MPLKITPEMRCKVAASYDIGYALPSDTKVTWQDYKCDGSQVTLEGYGYWVFTREEVIKMEMNPDDPDGETWEYDGITWVITPL